MTFALSLAAVDVLAQVLGVDPHRYPLAIPSVGVRADDRTRIARAVFADLAARDLVGADGVAPRVRRALRALADPDTAVAVAGAPDTDTDARTPIRSIRARGAVLGDYAVVAVQEDQFLRFTPVAPRALARTLVALLPRVPAGPGQSVRITHPAPAPPGPAETVPAVTAPVRPTRTADGTQRHLAAEILTRPRTGFGAFTVTRRGACSPDVPWATLTWIDTDAGRYLGLTRPAPGGTPTTTYSPADAPRLAQHLAELIPA